MGRRVRSFMTNGRIIIARSVFYMIPALQRVLHALRSMISGLMNRIDELGFQLAKRLPADDR